MTTLLWMPTLTIVTLAVTYITDRIAHWLAPRRTVGLRRNQRCGNPYHNPLIWK